MNLLLIRGIGLFICAFLNLLLTIFLAYRGRRQRVVLHFSLMGLFSTVYAIACGSVYLFWDSGVVSNAFVYKTTWLGVFMLPPYLVFIKYFLGKSKNIRIISLLLYSGAAIISFLSLGTSYLNPEVYLSYPNIVGKAGPLDFLGRLYILFCLGLGLFYLLPAYFQSTGIKKTQIRYLAAGIFIYAMVGIITTGILPLITGESGYYDVAAYFSFFWVAFTAYAIFKYRLMDLSLVLGRIAIYFFCGLTVIIIGYLAMLMSSGFVIPVVVKMIWFTSLLFVAFVFRPMFRFYERIAARYFYYTFYSFQQSLVELSEKFNKIIELEKLIDLILSSLLGALKAGAGGIVLKDSNLGDMQARKLINFSKTEIESLLKQGDGFVSGYFSQKNTLLVREEIPFLFKRRENKENRKNLEILQENMKKSKINILLPLFVGDALIGIIFLGDKLTGDAYSIQEINLLSGFVGQLSLALSNAMSYEEIERRKAELEKFYKLTVGRELRMAELKSKIKKLEEQTKK